MSSAIGRSLAFSVSVKVTIIFAQATCEPELERVVRGPEQGVVDRLAASTVSERCELLRRALGSAAGQGSHQHVCTQSEVVTRLGVACAVDDQNPGRRCANHRDVIQQGTEPAQNDTCDNRSEEHRMARRGGLLT